MKEKILQNLALKVQDIIYKNLTEDFGSERINVVDIVVTGKEDRQVTIYLYNKSGLDAQKLSVYHRKIYSIIEAMKEFSNGFSLEVSTPGIFRKIKYVKEFNIFLGNEIKIITQDDKIMIGICRGVKNNCLSLDWKNNKTELEQTKTIDLPVEQIKNAYLNG